MNLDDVPVYLGGHRVVARMQWGGRLVIPSYNIDVAGLALRDRVWEAAVTRLVQECLQPGQVSVDVGANFGYFVILDAMIVGHTGRVVAIEANPHIIPFLYENVHCNAAYHRVSVYHRAAWSRSGEELNLCFAPAFLGGGSARELWESDQSDRPVAKSLQDALWDHRLVETATDETGKVTANVPVVWFKVRSATIDEICADLPQAHLIHMDVEGAEAHALLGARKLIERSPDIRIIFEWAAQRWQHGNAEARAVWRQTWDWLRAQDFTVRELVRQEADGGLKMSEPLTFNYLCNEAPGGNFIALRPHVDPWRK
jgi:FkbM family methyltransferase